MVRIVNRLIAEKIIDPKFATNPQVLEKVMANITQHLDQVPRDLVRDMICYQVEQGQCTADAAMMDALKFGDWGLALVMVKDFNANPNTSDPVNGATCLHWAAFLKSAELMRTLVEKGAALDSITLDKGQSVAHWAALGADLACLVAWRELGGSFTVY